MTKPAWRAPLAALALLASLPAAAMPTDTPTAASADYKSGEKAANAGRFQEAVALFTRVVQKEPENADAHNMLGFSLRKSGDLDKAEAHYKTALQLKPEHKAALEYYGELFLLKKDLPRAEEQLGKLKKLCPSGCPELATLEKSVTKFKAGS